MAKNWTREEKLSWSKNEAMQALEEQTIRHIKMLAEIAKEKQNKETLSKTAASKMQEVGTGAKQLGEGMQQAARSAGEFKTQMTGVKDTLQNLDDDPENLDKILASLDDELAAALSGLLEQYYHQESEHEESEEGHEEMCTSCQEKHHGHEHEETKEIPVILLGGPEISDVEFKEAKDSLVNELRTMVNKAVDDKDTKLAYQIERTIEAILEEIDESL